MHPIKTSTNKFVIGSLQVSRYRKSIVARPLESKLRGSTFQRFASQTFWEPSRNSSKKRVVAWPSAKSKELGQKSCRTKVPWIFWICIPEFCSEFYPNFSRSFRALFPGRRRHTNFTKNHRHFSMPNPQANSEKTSTKVFWSADKVTKGVSKQMGFEMASFLSFEKLVPVCFATCLGSSKTTLLCTQNFKQRDRRRVLFVTLTDEGTPVGEAKPKSARPLALDLSAAFYAAYGFTGAFGRNLCKFTFPQRRRNLRKCLLGHKTYTGVKRAKK